MQDLEKNMQLELENRHHEKGKSWKEIWSTGIKLKSTLVLIFFNVLLHQVNISEVDRIPLFTVFKRNLCLMSTTKTTLSKNNRIVIIKKRLRKSCCANGRNGLFMEIPQYIRQETVYQVKGRPNKGNRKKSLASFTET